MTADDTNDPHTLALQALVWVLQDQPRADRLLALTGLDAATLRAQAGDPAVLSGVIAFLEGYEPDLIACAEALGVQPRALLALPHRLFA